jgi:hypothetical protein
LVAEIRCKTLDEADRRDKSKRKEGGSWGWYATDARRRKNDWQRRSLVCAEKQSLWAVGSRDHGLQQPLLSLPHSFHLVSWRRLLTGSFVKHYVTKRSLYTEEDLLWHAGELYTIHLDVQLTTVVLLEFASSLSLVCIALDFAALLSNSQA